MNIVLHCGGMPFNGDTIKTESLGGSETAAYYVAKELAAHGHQVMLFTNHPKGGLFDGVHYTYCGEVTQEAPLGVRFHTYAINTLMDVLIIQRHPIAFRFPFQAKLKFWWLHDLAQGRLRDEVNKMFWNMDGVFTVSKWHAEQVKKVWGLPNNFVMPIQNGVDLSLYENEIPAKLAMDENQFKLLYTARPERGLINLVRENGIMDRLRLKMPSAHLYLATYKNGAHQLQGLYDYLERRIKELPNVTMLGNLTKQELANLQRLCDLYVYPTEFEDTSCITMMECMAAGLPILASHVAALPETCNHSGTDFIANKEDGVDIDKFVESIVYLAENEEDMEEMSNQQLAAAMNFDWSHAAKMMMDFVNSTFEKVTENKGSLLKHYIHLSDIYAAKALLDSNTSDVKFSSLIVRSAAKELEECYSFAFQNKWAEHYKAYYQYEKDRGVNYGPENIYGNPRFECVSDYVANNVTDGRTCIDYGCAHGHYTISLAKRFPEKQFIGIDITQSNVDKARAWADAEGLTNVEFYHGQLQETADGTWEFTNKKIPLNIASMLIAAEVLEHVEKPGQLAYNLQKLLLRDGGVIVTTTPYGPWEAEGYDKHWPWRAHVHHLERDDLKTLFGEWPGYEILAVSSGLNKDGEILGSYIVKAGKYINDKYAEIENKRFSYGKHKVQSPRQTLSTCIIVKDGEANLRRCLDSVIDVSDEIIIGIDSSTTDRTRDVIDSFINTLHSNKSIVYFNIEPATKSGFAQARNTTIEKASGDWVLWIDSDEVLVHSENMKKFLRNNLYNGYAVKQHHFSVDPLGVQRTDIPCRLFRNNIGIKFFGMVHEHPETGLNESVKPAMLIPDIAIAHYGYTTDEIRVKRFDRNLPLLVKDREQLPDRRLGKFLWVRDLAQMCKFEAQATGVLSDAMVKRAQSGIDLFETMIDDKEIPVHLVLDGLEFYSILVQVVDSEAAEYGFAVDVSKLNGGSHPENGIYKGKFLESDTVARLMTRLLKEKAGYYEQKYF